LDKAMRRARLFLIVIGLMSAATGNSPAWRIKVIANPSVRGDKVSLRELKSVYLGKISSLSDGTHIEPVLAKRGLAHEDFLRQCLDQSNDQLQLYYRSLVFSGKGSMPKEVNSDAEMVAYVARTKNAIGYVSVDANTDGVKTMYVESSIERKLITRVEPQYPEILREKQIGGIVRLEVTIAANGTVQSVAILGGNPILAEAAETAVRKWVYAPGRSQTLEVSIPFDASH
jgi:TonB family protein